MPLVLTKVSKSFAGRWVLKQISWNLPPGITLLQGANGAGKTTFLRVLAGLLKPDAGSITWTGAVSGTATELGEAESIGYLGHGTSVYARLTAWENLQFWGKLHGCDCSLPILKGCLERVGLQAWAGAKAGVFSRGMTQRLNLARLLLIKPQVWLLDEPGTGLDAVSMQILHTEILAAKLAGAQVVWISHHPEDAILADRVLQLADCRLQEAV